MNGKILRWFIISCKHFLYANSMPKKVQIKRDLNYALEFKEIKHDANNTYIMEKKL